MEIHDKHRTPCLFISFTVHREEMPSATVQDPPVIPKHDREFHAVCYAIDGKGWLADITEVEYEERGDAETGPMGLDIHWIPFAQNVPLEDVPIWRRASGITDDEHKPDVGRFYAATLDLDAGTADMNGLTEDVDPDSTLVRALERVVQQALFEEQYIPSDAEQALGELKKHIEEFIEHGEHWQSDGKNVVEQVGTWIAELERAIKRGR